MHCLKCAILVWKYTAVGIWKQQYIRLGICKGRLQKEWTLLILFIGKKSKGYLYTIYIAIWNVWFGLEKEKMLVKEDLRSDEIAI